MSTISVVPDYVRVAVGQGKISLKACSHKRSLLLLILVIQRITNLYSDSTSECMIVTIIDQESAGGVVGTKALLHSLSVA